MSASMPLKIRNVPQVQTVDLGVLLSDLFQRKSSGVVRRLRMVGNAEILIAALPHCLRHLGEAVDAVRELGVGVQDAADVAVAHQARQTTGESELDFVVALAQFRLYERQPERRVNVRLALG